MMNAHNRRGSALLIVLGMMAFILASAIAFSAYMRYSRMPSSYLRRTSSSRQLVKAALAEAIDIVDKSIGNSTYPGQTGQMYKDYNRLEDEKEIRVVDYWQGRCFIGTNELMSVNDTVSTLTTEALAYIPPPLINEVRYYSRRSLAAGWHNLGFDAGRFAFTAVDVSDFYDINRVRGSYEDQDGNFIYGRTSADEGRINLAHVFANSDHTGFSGDCDPDRWDEFIDNYNDDPSKVPLISVADLNLAMNKHGLPAFMSPFCNFIRNGAEFVTSESGPQADLLRNLNFVTDSYFAVTNRPAGFIDLSRGDDQPLASPYDRADTLSANDVALSTLINGEHNNFTRNLERHNSPFFQAVEWVQLYDYLDKDSLPSSLALPTAEETPMITGVSLGGEFSVLVDKNTYEKEVADVTGVVNTKYEVTTYTLKLVGNMQVDAGAVYPFKYDRGADGNYSMEAVATVAFIPECNVESEGLLRCQNANAAALANCSDGWSGINANWEALQLADGKISILRAKSQSAGISFNKEPKNEDDTKIEDLHLNFQAFGAGSVFAAELAESQCYNKDVCTYRKCIKKDRQMVNGVVTWVQDTGFQDPTPIKDRVGFLPCQKDLSGAIAAADIGSGSYIPSVQVWVRIFNENGTVDLSPATWQDDKSQCEILNESKASSRGAMLRFRNKNLSDSAVKIDNESNELKLMGAGVFAAYPGGYIADDPRFNFAPEDFRILGDSDMQAFKDLWLQGQRSGGGDRDGDIFMYVSNAGYLQSAYELANIVKVSASDNNPFGILQSSAYNGNARTAFSDCPGDAAMWRTYSQYDNGHASNDIEPLEIISGSKGFRINPYTQSEDIMLSALAFTPVNWWAAGTNFVNDAKLQDLHSSWEKAHQYTFSDWSGAKMKVDHDDIRKIAKNMMAKFRNPSAGDWRGEYDALGWNLDNAIAGVELTESSANIHSIDRKFLHGYWKECFEERQQLFLVFVRAEPMMMGGGGVGQTPPQLGARAVALVWRDPAKTSNQGMAGFGPAPHRTRVLFYRQFD